jgi:Hint domain
MIWIVDTTTLINLAKSGTPSDPYAGLNTLLSSGNEIVITDTIAYEATRGDFVDADTINQWIETNENNGGIAVETTSIGDADYTGAGDDSIAEYVETLGEGSYTILTDNPTDFVDYPTQGTVETLNDLYDSGDIGFDDAVSVFNSLEQNAPTTPDLGDLYSDETLFNKSALADLVDGTAQNGTVTITNPDGSKTTVPLSDFSSTPTVDNNAVSFSSVESELQAPSSSAWSEAAQISADVEAAEGGPGALGEGAAIGPELLDMGVEGAAAFAVAMVGTLGYALYQDQTGDYAGAARTLDNFWGSPSGSNYLPYDIEFAGSDLSTTYALGNPGQTNPFSGDSVLQVDPDQFSYSNGSGSTINLDPDGSGGGTDIEINGVQSVEPDVSSDTFDFDASYQLSDVSQDNTNGTSQTTTYGADGSSVTNYYTGLNGTGTLTETDTENADGTSRITMYNPDGSSVSTDYSGPHGSGAIISGPATTVELFSVDEAGSYYLSAPSVAGLADGNFVITWDYEAAVFQDGEGPDPGPDQTYIVEVTPTGQVIGSSINAITGVGVAVGASGNNLMMAYTNFAPGDSGSETVSVQSLNSNLQITGSSIQLFTVDEAGSYYLSAPSVAGLADGNFVITWDYEAAVFQDGEGPDPGPDQTYIVEVTPTGQVIGGSINTITGVGVGVSANGNVVGAAYTGTDENGNEVSSVTVMPQNDIACFLRGTQILTPSGEVPVEELAIGECVITVSGDAKPIKWIGHRSFNGRFITGNRQVLPICITAEALTDGVPRRDLWVSPGHSILLDGVLVLAEQLVNGATIVQAEKVNAVEYFHIELDSHDVIFADGAPAETFVDCDNRMMFANGAEYGAIYPDDERPRWRFCLPRLDWGDAALTEIRAALLRRAEACGHELTLDPELLLVADGTTIRPGSVDDCVYRFIVPAGSSDVRLLSRNVVPAEVDGNSRDIRRLGVPVERLVLSDSNLSIEVRHGHDALSAGFHDNETGHRWTDGLARLPEVLLRPFTGPFQLELQLVPSALSYRLPMPEHRAAPVRAVGT